MENSGYKGIKKWMEQCEKDTAGIKVKLEIKHTCSIIQTNGIHSRKMD